MVVAASTPILGADSRKMYDFPSISAIGTKDFSAHIATDTCLILQYHRIASLCHDPLQLAVQPYNFERQMQYLAENCNVISMDKMKLHLESATPFTNRTVVVTFDGGYADVLYTAKEVLEKYGVCATVFASSAGIIEAGEFWRDKLEDLIIAGDARGSIELEIDGQGYMWSLRTSRDAFRSFDVLCSIMPNMTPSAQKRIISQISLALGSQAEEKDSHRMMDAQELQMLENGGLITIGGHTHNIVKLSTLPRWLQIEEVGKNKESLEEALSHPVEYFSYPFGNEADYTADSSAILEDIGFTLACGTSYGTVSAAKPINCYELPRVKVGNWNPFTFYKFLEGFFT